MSGLPTAWGRWLGAALTVLLLAVLTWQAFLAGPSQTGTPAPPGGDAVGIRLLMTRLLATSDAVRLVPRVAAAAPASAASAVEPTSQGTAVCGMGRLQADASGELVNPEILQAAAYSARVRLLPVLASSPDELARAAALVLQGSSERSAPARDALARMALATRSPQVYGWALQACGPQRKDGACAMLSPEQWARLDPNNAVPWLQVATEARVRGDTAAVAEALFRVSRASRSDLRWGALAGVARAHLPTTVPALAKGALVQELISIEGSFPMPYLVANQYCAEADVRDANRQQTCAAVAEVLSTQGRTLIDLGLGAAIGQRVGWGPERLNALRDERDAIAQAQVQLLPAPAELWSCAGIDTVGRYVTDVARDGELAVMRRVVKQSPEGIAVLARRHREIAARPSASAASAAAAASAT